MTENLYNIGDYFYIIILMVFILFLIIRNIKNKQKTSINHFDDFFKKILIGFKDINLNIKKPNNTNIIILINIENIENIEDLNIEKKINTIIQNELEKNKEIIKDNTNYNIIFDKKEIKIYIDIHLKDESYLENFIK